MPAAIDRTRILESVLAVWREDGYRGATTRKIAELAGVSEMTLFRRFGDKPKLFQAALQMEAERFTTDATPYTGALEADLERIVSAYEALLERNAPLILDFLLEAPRNRELAGIGPIPLEAIGQIARVVAQYQREGRLKQEPPFNAVVALLSPLLATVLLRRAQPVATLGVVVRRADHVRCFLYGRSPDGR